MSPRRSSPTSKKGGTVSEVSRIVVSNPELVRDFSEKYDILSFDALDALVDDAVNGDDLEYIGDWYAIANVFRDLDSDHKIFGAFNFLRWPFNAREAFARINDSDPHEYAGFAYAPAQDLDGVEEKRRFTLGFGAFGKDPGRMNHLAIGFAIVDTLRKKGLEVIWNETPDDRIWVVNVDLWNAREFLNNHKNREDE